MAWITPPATLSVPLNKTVVESWTIMIVPLNGLNYPTCISQWMLSSLDIKGTVELCQCLWTSQSPHSGWETCEVGSQNRLYVGQYSALHLNITEDTTTVQQKLVVDQSWKKTLTNKLELQWCFILCSWIDDDSIQVHIKTKTENFEGKSVVSDPVAEGERVVQQCIHKMSTYTVTEWSWILPDVQWCCGLLICVDVYPKNYVYEQFL